MKRKKKTNLDRRKVRDEDKAISMVLNVLDT